MLFFCVILIIAIFFPIDIFSTDTIDEVSESIQKYEHDEVIGNNEENNSIEENEKNSEETQEDDDEDTIKLEILQNEEIQNKKTIVDIIDTWKELNDKELNEIIANSGEDELGNFLSSLNSKELDEILKKDTMLKNTINIYVADDQEKEISTQTVESSQIYYEYLLELSKISGISFFSSDFSTQKGYFFIQISGDGKATKRKISVTLTSTNRKEQQTVTFSEVAVSGYSDNHNFTIITATSKTQLTDVYYTILQLQFSYIKTAHYLAKGSYSDKVPDYRFNFKKYTYENVGETTVNNTGHNTTNTREIIDVQINTVNCGIGTTTSGFVTSNATGYINLSKGYYSSLVINPNGGIHNQKSSTYTYGIKNCETTAIIENPVRNGYIFLGWTFTKGKNCSGASFNSNTNTFIFCGKSTSSSDISSDNTCTLKAEWSKIYGKIKITNVDEIDNNIKISDSIFQIYDSNNNLVEEKKTDSNGQILFENLELGKYDIYEIKVKEGYELYKSKIEIEINEKENIKNVLVENVRNLVLPETGRISLDTIFIIFGFSIIIWIIFRIKKEKERDDEKKFKR